MQARKISKKILVKRSTLVFIVELDKKIKQRPRKMNKQSLRKMKLGKKVGLYDILFDIWNCTREMKIQQQTTLFNKIFKLKNSGLAKTLVLILKKRMISKLAQTKWGFG